MDKDTRAPRRPNFLLRQVVVPSWLQVCMLVAWSFVVVAVMAFHPLLVVLALVIYSVFSFIGASRERLRTRRAPVDYTAVDVRAMLASVWREMCTYQVWMLIAIALVVVCTVMHYLGLLSI